MFEQVFECVWFVFLFYAVILEHFQDTLLPAEQTADEPCKQHLMSRIETRRFETYLSSSVSSSPAALPLPSTLLNEGAVADSSSSVSVPLASLVLVLALAVALAALACSTASRFKLRSS